ncbi:Ser/Thr and Tyr protein phosphatase (dual specificity) [hydrothermal vent metagenome]|uniref:Ser/Thr and Tyr protein phosphatase (Dual specificity) n=1 Tax=hydrothermal vent metagenome TaxID=652676 RepID=A0A3B0YG00_9ZZZZ
MNVGSQVKQADRLWRRASYWLLLLGPFFFLSYSFANYLASQQSNVPSIVFEWEHYIPFIPWTIIPYWFIDLFYVVSLFICTTQKELDSHAKRLLLTQCIAVIFFIAFPLTFIVERPESSGIASVMFTALDGFDKPFNQAPSLHISLLIVLWVVFARHLTKFMLWFCHAFALLIGVSVLTTYQHHFIDIPTGILLGMFCLWVLPDNANSPLRLQLSQDPRRWRLGLYYGVAALVLVVFSMIGGAALWLLWPAWSLMMVSLFYFMLGENGFQKNSRGQLSLAIRWMLFPYLIAARINALLWTRNLQSANHVIDNVYLGRFPSKKEIHSGRYLTVVDMTAEFHAPHSTIQWHAIPSLDLITPASASLISAAQVIEQANRDKGLLVCCGLGYSRSTLAILSWLLISKRADSVNEAVAIIKKVRPQIVLKETDYTVLETIRKSRPLGGNA